MQYRTSCIFFTIVVSTNKRHLEMLQSIEYQEYSGFLTADLLHTTN
jgi:hypothetical protein